jgi:hypothetical protein
MCHLPSYESTGEADTVHEEKAQGTQLRLAESEGVGTNGANQERQGLVKPNVMSKAIVRLIGLGVALAAISLSASAGVRFV